MNTTKEKRALLLLLWFCVGVLFVAGCIIGGNPASLPSTPSEIISLATLQALSTPLTIFDYQDQVTDGKILFSIFSKTETCVSTGQSYKLALSFKNLTREPINIPVDFNIASNRLGNGGNLNPFITTAEGADIYSMADTQFGDNFDIPSSEYYELAAGEEIHFEVDYHFPQLLSQIEKDRLIGYSTPTPGKYFLRLIYSEPSRDKNLWYGLTSSNRVEICII